MILICRENFMHGRKKNTSTFYSAEKTSDFCGESWKGTFGKKTFFVLAINVRLNKN